MEYHTCYTAEIGSSCCYLHACLQAGTWNLELGLKDCALTVLVTAAETHGHLGTVVLCLWLMLLHDSKHRTTYNIMCLLHYVLILVHCIFVVNCTFSSAYRATVLEDDRRELLWLRLKESIFFCIHSYHDGNTAARAEVEEAMKKLMWARLWGDQGTELKTKTRANTKLLWRKVTSKGLPPTLAGGAATAGELNPHTYRLSFVTANSDTSIWL